MIESIFASLQNLLYSEAYLISAFAVWFVTFVSGENGGLLSLTIAHQGLMNLFIAVTFTFLGSLSADVFWYFVTTKSISPLLDKRMKKKQEKKGEVEHKAFLGLADKYPYHILILIKFMVGIRLVLTIYIVAKHKIPFYKYLACNLLANTLFVGVLFLLVWTVGDSLEAVFATEKGLFGAITIIFVIAVAGNIFLRLMQHFIMKLLKSRQNKQ